MKRVRELNITFIKYHAGPLPKAGKEELQVWGSYGEAMRAYSLELAVAWVKGWKRDNLRQRRNWHQGS